MSKMNRCCIGVLFGAIVLASAASERAHGRHRHCPPPCPPQTVVLSVCHPCTGCHHDVPVCIPGCVLGVPCVHFQRTLIGQGKTVFQWPCGHRVIIRYNHSGYRVVQRG